MVLQHRLVDFNWIPVHVFVSVFIFVSVILPNFVMIVIVWSIFGQSDYCLTVFMKGCFFSGENDGFYALV